MVREIERIAALDAQEVAVDAAFIAVVSANDFRALIGLARTQSRGAAVTTVGAHGSCVVHLPRTRLVAVRAGGQRTDRTGIDAHTALLTLQMVLPIGSDHA